MCYISIRPYSEPNLLLCISEGAGGSVADRALGMRWGCAALTQGKERAAPAGPAGRAEHPAAGQRRARGWGRAGGGGRAAVPAHGSCRRCSGGQGAPGAGRSVRAGNGRSRAGLSWAASPAPLCISRQPFQCLPPAPAPACRALPHPPGPGPRLHGGREGPDPV